MTLCKSADDRCLPGNPTQQRRTNATGCRSCIVWGAAPYRRYGAAPGCAMFCSANRAPTRCMYFMNLSQHVLTQASSFWSSVLVGGDRRQRRAGAGRTQTEDVPAAKVVDAAVEAPFRQLVVHGLRVAHLQLLQDVHQARLLRLGQRRLDPERVHRRPTALYLAAPRNRPLFVVMYDVGGELEALRRRTTTPTATRTTTVFGNRRRSCALY